MVLLEPRRASPISSHGPTLQTRGATALLPVHLLYQVCATGSCLSADKKEKQRSWIQLGHISLRQLVTYSADEGTAIF